MEVHDINFTKICRCCKLNSYIIVSIFAEPEANSAYPRIDEMLMAIASLKIHEKDGLPSVLCTTCLDKVQNAFQLRQQLIQSESEFRGCIKNEKNDIEHDNHVEMMGNILRDILDEQEGVNDENNEVDNDDSLDKDYMPTIFQSHEKKKASKVDVFECEHCDKEYSSKKSLKRHNVRYHEKCRKFECTICQKVFGRVEHLKRHLHTHLKEKPFSCKKCTRGFNRLEKFKAHVNICNGKKDLSCEVCNKGFSQEATLEIHRQMHEADDSKKYCILTLKDLESYDRFCKEVYEDALDNQDSYMDKDDDYDDSSNEINNHKQTVSDDKVKKACRKKLKCNICESIHELENIREHLTTHLKLKPYCCETCNRSFDASEYLISHASICDGVLYLACDVCEEVFQEEHLLEKHNETHVNAQQTSQFSLTMKDLENHERFCSDVYEDDESLSMPEPSIQIEVEEDSDYEPAEEGALDMSDNEYKPYQTRHGKKKRKSIGTSSMKKRGRPKKTVPVTPPEVNPSQSTFKEFSCPLCPLTFKRVTLLESHGKDFHENDEVLRCPQCSKSFSRVYALNRHMKFHKLDSPPHTCSICSLSFNHKDDLLNHSKTHNENDAETACHDCCKVFHTLIELHEHMVKELHFGKDLQEKKKIKKRFECERCTKRFTTHKVLMIHMRKHAGDRNYVCPKCSKPFLSKSNLTEHMKFHDKIKKFLCSECGQSFIRNDYLVIHMRRHRGEKPFKCKFCGKGFPRVTDLTVHERYHTGEKTHLCVVCGRGFNRAYNLTVHMRTHTGEKPYKCSYCESAFAQCNDLKAHIRRHTGERFQCDLCSETFLMGYALTQHKRTVHGLNIVSNIRRLGATENQNPDESEPLLMELPKPVIPMSTDPAGFNPILDPVERDDQHYP